MSYMSEHLILQQDDPDFPLDPEGLIHALWKELFDLEIMTFMIWPFEYRCPAMMFPVHLKNSDYEFATPDETELYEELMYPSGSKSAIGIPSWVDRFRYKDGNSIRESLEYEINESAELNEAFTWPWILWSIFEAEERNEIAMPLGAEVIDVLEQDEIQIELSNEQHGSISLHLMAFPVAEPGPAFEGFVYSGNEAAEALPVIQSLLDLEPAGSTPDDNAYSHALMLFAVHPDSTPASLELIAESTSAAREFLQFNPSVTPDILAKIK